MKSGKIISIICAGALIMSLAACGKQVENTAQEDVNTTAADDTVTVTDTVTESETATVVFSDGGITADGASGVEIDGTKLTINKEGTYEISGSCADGSIKIAAGTENVYLKLNGLTLTSGDTAPIVCAKSSQVIIEVCAGTENTLSDSAENNDDEYPENTNAENAVIKCKDGSEVTLCGTGILNINANGKNGIKSGVSTDEDGEASLTVKELTLNITAPVNDGINAEQLLTIESGTLNIAAGDDAVHCDLVMNVGAENTDGPVINISECYEGIEAAQLNICSGDIDIVSTDDCLNTANSDLSGYSFEMNISGGSITAYSSEGDGFDSNGSMTISGGSIEVWTANTADNQPLDADGTITITGGTVLAAGESSGMGMNLNASQPYAVFGTSGGMGMQPGAAGTIISAGEAVTVKDSSGNEIYSANARCAVGYVFFSSDKLTESESVTLYSGDEQIAESQAQMGTMSETQPGGGFPGGAGGDFDMQPGADGTAPTDGEAPTGQPPEKPDGMPENSKRQS